MLRAVLLGVLVGGWAAPLHCQSVEVTPGGVVRWQAEGTETCSLDGRFWAPIGDACWYAIDPETQGRLVLTRTVRGEVQELTVVVGGYPYPEQRLQVADSMVNLSEADAARAARDAQRITELWQREGVPRFTLPLLPPLKRSEAGRSFGARRYFNDEPRSPHSGVDFRAAAGTPVRAAAEGLVVIAEEHFFGGNSVFVDHGGGLVSCYLHLSSVAVEEGQSVTRGQVVGRVGATGRVTGPHLHFGVRWHGARVDPALVLGSVEEVPLVAGEVREGTR